MECLNCLDKNTNWQAEIVIFGNKWLMPDGTYQPEFWPVSTRKEAEIIAEYFGCEIEREEDGEYGQWVVTIPEEWLNEIRKNGFVHKKNNFGSIHIEIGDED